MKTRSSFGGVSLWVVLNMALLAWTAHASTIVYSNLGPMDTYDPMFGDGVGTVGGFPRTIAMEFTAGASGNLATIDIALTFGDNGAQPVNVFLYADASNSPSGSGTLLGSVTPTAMFQTTNNSLVTLNVLGTVPVTLGTNYWLALQPTSPFIDVWNQTLPVVNGGTASSIDGGATWFPVLNDPLDAFRITANPAGSGVPESGSALWLLLGSMVTIVAVRRAQPERCEKAANRS